MRSSLRHLLGSPANPASVAVGIALLMSSCGAIELDLEQKIEIVMFGVFKTAEAASGTSSPKYLEIDLAAASLTTQDGEAIDLLEEVELGTQRIVNRPQILLTASLKGFEGQTITATEVTLSEAIVIGGVKTPEHAVTLSSPTISYPISWEVIKSKTNRLEIEVYWKNILIVDETDGTESAGQPSFVATLNPE